MASLTAAEKKYTYEDYLKTPEDERYEFIEGELIVTPAPSTEHQRISRKLGFKIVKFVEENNFGEVFYAPCDVCLDKENVVQPDILFISEERLNIIGEKNIHGVPDLVVEIISESSVYRDTINKKMLYAKFGVKEYWIIAPSEKMIEVYLLKDKEYKFTKIYLHNDTLKSQVLEGFKLDLKEIF